ncbi:centromeric protein E [Carpediemonas membranifera]|uniref:Centromeric protein E n=1 Tax=Carpediemonas membranifera TaxID=201153 RepID=A0A8J6BY69_9EUKA|nr:centromeric protein E [Carpediemonas membranifera]|eukprot:KAG9394191.1 centromeric protein E [Carpediemonas membranifera]
MADNIKVAIRIRPLIAREDGQSIVWNIQQANTDHPKVLTCERDQYNCFDLLFDTNSTNTDVFNSIAKPIIDGTLEGINGAIMAYGQTSSGKTHTMKGDTHSPGIIPQALEYIFNSIANAKDREYSIRVSCVEIYNEVLRDLLSADDKDQFGRTEKSSRINIHTHSQTIKKGRDEKGQPQSSTETIVRLTNCTERTVYSAAEALEFSELGFAGRAVAETKMNTESSRSHAIFRVYIESTELINGTASGSTRIAHLNLVDLAGSERVKESDVSGIGLREAGNINKSLSVLSQVINELVKVQEQGRVAVHMPYRNSKLTRLLEPALGGNSRTALICNITPARNAIEASRSTITFATSARNVKNAARVNIARDDDGVLTAFRQELGVLRQDVDRLHSALADAKAEGARYAVTIEELNRDLTAARILEEDSQAIQQSHDRLVGSLEQFRKLSTVNREQILALERLVERLNEEKAALETELVQVLEGFNIETTELEKDRNNIRREARQAIVARDKAVKEMERVRAQFEKQTEIKTNLARATREAKDEHKKLERAEVGLAAATEAKVKAEEALATLKGEAESDHEKAVTLEKELAASSARVAALSEENARLTTQLASSTAEATASGAKAHGLAREADFLRGQLRDERLATFMTIKKNVTLEASLTKATADVTRLEASTTELQAVCDGHEETIGRMRVDLNAVTQAEAGLRQDLAAAKERLLELESRLFDETARADTAERTVRDGQVRLEELHDSVRGMNRGLEETIRDKAALEEELSRVKSEHHSVDAQCAAEIGRKEAEAEGLRITVKELEDRVVGLESELTGAKFDLKSTVDELTADRDAAQARVSELDAIVAELNANMPKPEEIAELESTRDGLQQQLKELTATVARLEQEAGTILVVSNEKARLHSMLLAEFHGLEGDYDSLADEHDETLRVRAELETKLAAAESKYEKLVSSHDKLQDNYKQLTDARASRADDEAQAELARLGTELESALEERDHYRDERDMYRERIKEGNKAIEASVRRRKAEFTEKMKAMSKEISDKRHKINELVMQLQDEVKAKREAIRMVRQLEEEKARILGN